MSDQEQMAPRRPKIESLGDQALIVRFGDRLDDAANRAALALARRLHDDPPVGAEEIVPSLVSVLVRYDPFTTEPVRLAGEISLRLSAVEPAAMAAHRVGVHFGGEDGPDLDEVADDLKMAADEFVHLHCASTLRVLATGFAPGFVYCGFHAEDLTLPRRQQVRPLVPAGSILFAAGQTAIAATDIPTGWHVIGRSAFRNFDQNRDPPTLMSAGDQIVFEAE